MTSPEVQNSTDKITPVILAGGVGTRLWPLSRKSYPKQFSTLTDGDSLFQKTAIRLSSSDLIKFKNHIILTNSDYRFIVTEQLQEIGIDPGLILIEPISKNTAPAILASCILAMKEDEESILLIAPSDHLITDNLLFHENIIKGLSDVKDGGIITFGIKPTRPETGYGYLEVIDNNLDTPSKLKTFLEKPSIDKAQEMINSNSFLWNSGIFMFKAKVMLNAFEVFASELIEPVKKSINYGKYDLGFFKFDENEWQKNKNISIDYAIMENANNLHVVPYSGYWSDLGGWSSLWKSEEKDINGTVISKNTISIDCKNSLLRSESDSQQLVGLGLDKIVAIAMPDAVLVADIDKSQEVKNVVTKLNKLNIKQAEHFPKDHRPWGWFETLAYERRFQVKKILVKPDASLSLQSHKYRSEHWVVVEGIAKITIDNEIQVISEGQSAYIPLGSVHRLENPGKKPLIIIEIQTGSYLGEDDIIRYQDKYSRK